MSIISLTLIIKHVNLLAEIKVSLETIPGLNLVIPKQLPHRQQGDSNGRDSIGSLCPPARHASDLLI